MAIDTTAKTTIEVKADTTQAQKAIRDLAQETAKGNAELKKQAEQASLVGKKFEELGKSMVGLQMHDAFKRVSASVSEVTSGVIDLNGAFAGFQAAGPWGAVIGALGGALVKFAVGLHDVEKRATEFRKMMPDMAAASDRLFEGYNKQQDAIRAMNDRLAETPYRLAKVLDGFKDLYPALKKAREEIQAYDSAPARLNRGLRAGGKGLQDFIGDITTRGLGVSSWGGLKFKSGGRGGASYDGAATDLGSQIAGNIGSYDYLQAMQDRADAASRLGTSNMIRSSADLGGYAGLQSQVDAFNSGEFGRRNAEAYGDFATGQQQSFLEKTFGPVDQFDIYAQGFQALTGAVGSALGAWIDGSKSAGEAVREFTSEALKGLAIQMSTEAIKHGAYALGNLAIGNFAGASMHGKAAAAFGVGAALAAGGAKALGSGWSGGGASAGGATGASAPNVSGGSGGGTPGRNITIVYGDSYADDNPRNRQLRAERDIERVMGTRSVELH